jgi:hypothetical protein
MLPVQGLSPYLDTLRELRRRYGGTRAYQTLRFSVYCRINELNGMLCLWKTQSFSMMDSIFFVGAFGHYADQWRSSSECPALDSVLPDLASRDNV